MEEYNLEPILEYSMTPDEALAFKLGLMWIEISRKLFPNSKNMTSYPKRGDPRKGSLFKHCYTLLRETRDRVDAKDYKLFINAQLQMLKAIEINGQHPLIGPWCLLGDKAWIRWKMWKKKFENINKTKTTKDVDLETPDIEEVKTELAKSKKYLFSTEEDFKINAGDVERAIKLGKISGFYAILSPWVKKYCNLEEIDLSYCAISPEISNYFMENFPKEF